MTYLLVPDTVIDKDEDAVKSIKDTEGGSDWQRWTVQEQESESPRENHQEQECDGAPQPSPAGQEKGERLLRC